MTLVCHRDNTQEPTFLVSEALLRDWSTFSISSPNAIFFPLNSFMLILKCLLLELSVFILVAPTIGSHMKEEGNGRISEWQVNKWATLPWALKMYLFETMVAWKSWMELFLGMEKSHINSHWVRIILHTSYSLHPIDQPVPWVPLKLYFKTEHSVSLPLHPTI